MPTRNVGYCLAHRGRVINDCGKEISLNQVLTSDLCGGLFRPSPNGIHVYNKTLVIKTKLPIQWETVTLSNLDHIFTVIQKTALSALAFAIVALVL